MGRKSLKAVLKKLVLHEVVLLQGSFEKKHKWSYNLIFMLL